MVGGGITINGLLQFWFALESISGCTGKATLGDGVWRSLNIVIFRQIIFVMLKELIVKNRSYRRFYGDKGVDMEVLKELVDLARLSPSARNVQSIKYFLANTREINEKIFPCLTWAGYLKDWQGAKREERPAAYIVMLNDTEISENYFCDDGIAAQSMLLGAVEKGLGGCIVGSVDRLKLKRELGVADHLKIIQVIALGVPQENVTIEEMVGGDVKYWRDEEQGHHVPKRKLEDLIIS